jgi:hypothetical protein
MATIDVKDAAGLTVAVEKPLAPGRLAAAASKPMVLSNEDLAVLNAISTALGSGALDRGQGSAGANTLRVTIDSTQAEGTDYETVAASQTAQVLGGAGAAGDYISGLLVVPETTTPGQVLLLDNAISITVFAGGASSVSNLIPFYVPLGMISTSGAWKVTTGASVHVIAIGNFT